MKPVPIQLPGDDSSVYSKNSKNSKARRKNKPRPKMPQLHRASSAEKFQAHPNHGTLDSSAAQVQPDMEDLSQQGGKPWWEGQMASRGASNGKPPSPLPPTSSSAISSAMEELATEEDEILNMEVRNKSLWSLWDQNLTQALFTSSRSERASPSTTKPLSPTSRMKWAPCLPSTIPT